VNKNQESRLEGIFGCVRVPEHAAADAKHHGTMPLNYDGEGGLVPAGYETLQELAIGQVLVRWGRARESQVAERFPERCLCHGCLLRAFSTFIVRLQGNSREFL
jgi:hypothetical protein